jgi:HD-GYP domain-containing protein (c-di-GMP phosphodiesterase class II)
VPREADDIRMPLQTRLLLAPLVAYLTANADWQLFRWDAHASNVADLAGRLAVELGCNPSQASAIRLAAHLHDIGKVAIPDAILLKPGPLTESEWLQMKTHPVIGSDVVGLIPELRSIAPIVRAHHERWDGSGYPDGLAGEEIPLPARILSVADAFDAMVAERPYSEPMPEAAALSEVMRCGGTQFDPRVVMAMKRTLDPAQARPVAKAAEDHCLLVGHSQLVHQT